MGKVEINVKNATLNSEKHALHEKLELIQSEVNRRDDIFFCFIMNQTMNKMQAEQLQFLIWRL